jgi:hypothetical protein
VRITPDWFVGRALMMISAVWVTRIAAFADSHTAEDARERVWWLK